MKKTKKLALGLGALLMSLTAASGVTGTLAWFTAANTVSVTGLQFQAAAEKGIVISNEAESEWKTDITASHNGSDLSFVPTSTYNVSDWWHAYSTDANNAVTTDTLYTKITPEDTKTVGEPAETHGATNDGAFGYLEGNTWKHVYLLNKFYVKASTPVEINGQDIFIKNVAAKVGNNNTAQELSKGLRVAFIATGETSPLIFAPVEGADAENDIALTLDEEGKKATYQRITPITDSSVETNKIKTNYSIPAYNSESPLEVNVYIYFEGEDSAVKSTNILSTTLDTMSVSFKLGNKTTGA